ncbi:hypothetical protein J6590_074798 [Homalodisca vitripennis]|nr:hypothetical protein J6590_074798 [Homalodisca vitripennis]
MTKSGILTQQSNTNHRPIQSCCIMSQPPFLWTSKPIRGYRLKTGFFLALPRPPDSTGARVSLACMNWLPYQLANNLLGRSSARWRPDRALLRSWGALLRPLIGGTAAVFGGGRI